MLDGEMGKINVCDMENFGTPGSSEKTIAVVGDRWWPQTAKQEGDTISKKLLCEICEKMNIYISARMLEVSLLLKGVMAVLRLERDAWSMVK